jgi:hypothetical protein
MLARALLFAVLIFVATSHASEAQYYYYPSYWGGATYYAPSYCYTPPMATNCCAPRQTVTQRVVAPCEQNYEPVPTSKPEYTSVQPPRYSAFLGPEGKLFGVDGLDGTVYQWDGADWRPLPRKIP